MDCQRRSASEVRTPRTESRSIGDRSKIRPMASTFPCDTANLCCPRWSEVGSTPESIVELRSRSMNCPAAFTVAMQSLDSTTSVSVRSSVGGAFQSELFRGLGAASSVFECAPLGISPRYDGSLEAVQMVTKRWEIDSVQLDDVTSSYFDDESRFPAGTISFDSALLMRDVEVEWRRHPLHLQG